ncbi:MAG: class I SAM-dependent methyltransferase [Chloroflexota bacterium]
MGIYEQYAAVYDRSGQLAFSHRMAPYLERLLKRHPVAGREMVELACGTGTVAIALARAGWRVLAVDASAAMLAQAQAKLGEDPLDIGWSQQDMRRLRVPAPVHLVTCLYDSMNYMLSDEDLLTVFASVRAALRPGGLFLFDMNTVFAMRALWNDETYFTDGDDLAVVFKSRYDERAQRTTVRVTCFQRVDALYRKIAEEHTEQAYPPEHVATLLTDVGLAVEAQYDCFSLHKPSPTAFRIMFVARRPPELPA